MFDKKATTAAAVVRRIDEKGFEAAAGEPDKPNRCIVVVAKNP